MSPPEHLAVIGDPIEHSLSPTMQAAALAAAGLDWIYEAHRVGASTLASWVTRVRSEAYRGFNVTIPHKLAVRPYLDEIMASAQRVGAVNTVVRNGDRLIGHNTDLAGFTQALLALCSLTPAGRPDTWGIRAVVFGAGGAARAVVNALADLGARTTIVSRSATRAAALAGGLDNVNPITYDDSRLPPEIEEAGLLVNATSLGMSHLADQSPLPPGVMPRSETVVMDLVYGRKTPLLAQAEAQGCACADGLEMLVRQGAESFRLWTGVEPDLEIMRDACRRRLEELQPC